MAQVEEFLNVSATVAGGCRILSVKDVDFGDYDPTDPTDDTDGAGYIEFRCVQGTDYELYISGSRSMTNGSDNLDFELYTDPAASSTIIPDDVTGTKDTAGDNDPIMIDIYGRIVALQNVGFGNYSADLMATIDY